MENLLMDRISQSLKIPNHKIQGTANLLDEGNTIPFITRYRKEATGGLNEEQIQAIQDQLEYQRNLEERRKEITEKIGEQGKLTSELEKQITAASQLKILEDIYLPFRPKRRTKATAARELGLEPLAQKILALGNLMPSQAASEYISSENDIDESKALQGAMDIIAEIISENAQVRELVRKISAREGEITVKKISKTEDNEKIYQDYYDYNEPITKIPPHRILAIDRGETAKVLRVKLTVGVEKIFSDICRLFIKNAGSPLVDLLEDAIRDSYKRLVAPSIEREIRNELRDNAHLHAIEVFGQNLRNLLLQPPLVDMSILAIDPGYVSGCKLAVISETGELLNYGVIYPHQPKAATTKAYDKIKELYTKYKFHAVAIGNGTACRETENFISDFIAKEKIDLVYTIVNEAGASVYSASAAAREEFPDLDASFRGTISIGRRLLDPLAELVKIDPKSLGIGLYQHDLNAKLLNKALHRVVESCVNYVGVDINRASKELLSYVSGINNRIAKNIISKRKQLGRFASRDSVNKVSGIGSETFTQCAGFLRIPGGDNVLDNTAIHPESYGACDKLLTSMGNSSTTLGSFSPEFQMQLKQMELKSTAEKLAIGIPTLKDIVENLLRPGRDPREELPLPLFRKGVMTMDDLEKDMILQGTVRNVVDFGAFVDIGIKADGLVHISQMANQFIKNPMEICKVGDNVEVRILNVDKQRERISLSMILEP